MNGRKSPNEDNSRSVSPNDMSNFSDNSDGSSDENMTAENFSELKIDVERYDDDDRDDSNMDDEESEAAPSHNPFGTSPNFSSYFQPSSYEGFPVPSTSQPGPSTSSGCAVGGPSNNEGSDSIIQDPTYYQDLLPRIGSNDNSWESLIEITKTSETSKLQHLVDNLEHKLVEPNQCIICHRVLSCKSALQMHYRTHTGERPFKCKLCSRAFTTKGNLKTHMGVHRTKPATRLMHQCPVCHKPYPNALLLQQHIRSHTENPNLQLAPLYASCEDRPPTLMPSYPRQFLMPPQLMNAEPLALTSSKPQEKSTSTNESVIKSAPLEANISLNQCSSPALSSAGSCSPPCNTDENVNKELQPPILDLAQPDQDDMNEEKMSHSPSDIPKITDDNDDSNDRGTLADRSSPGENQNDFDTKVKQELPNLTHSPKSFIGNQENENVSPSNYSVKSPPKYSPSENPLISLASDRPLPMTLSSDIPLPFSMHNSDRPYPPMSVPDFTTASLTALENHVKGIASNVSHPLPFPPPFGLTLNVPNFYRDYSYQHKSNSSPSASKNGSDGSADDRSTPGSAAAPSSKGESPRTTAMITYSTPKSESSNGIGALDLTPRNSPGFHRPAGTDVKIFAPMVGLPFVSPHNRMGTTCRICFKTFACQSALEIHYRSHTKERPFRCDVCDRGFSTKGNMRQHMLTHKIRDLPAQVFTKCSTNSNSNSSITNSSITNNSNNNSSTPPNPPNPPPKIEPVEEKSPKKPSEEVVKRSPADISLPQPKRPPGQPKHLCQVCTKPFSSGSALQIHMRTHTGDKPFQCHICHRAFTTKGNLKVHMGTHMWNNSTSRRGRRMSLDISPLQLTPGAKPGDFPQASYFPYLTPFLNGLPPPPQPQQKMNEISVIQTAGVSNGAIVTASPATTSSSAPSTPQQPLPLLSTSKREEQIPSQNQNYLPGHC